MPSPGVTFKRCGCRDADRRRLEQSCPRLSERGHGTWYFHCSATNLLGRRERARRGGYPSQNAARQARDEFLASSAADRTAEGWTVERWLRHWLDTRTSIRPTTRFHYTRDVDTVLIPYLGRYRLADLDAQLLRTVFAAIADTRNNKGRPQSPSAMNHLRTTLRAALNLAVKEGVLDCNPARHIEIKGYQQPHAKVWTEARVESWEQTGAHPSVAVWTADQLAEFLGSVNDDPLFAFWWLAGQRGLRRGELCGLRWNDIDLDRGVLTIERNRTTVGYQVVEGDPKTPAGRRAVALDKRTCRSCGCTAVTSRTGGPRRSRTANRGPTPATCSPDPTGCRSTRTTPPPGSGSSRAAPGCPRSRCTTSVTAPRPWRMRRARI